METNTEIKKEINGEIKMEIDREIGREILRQINRKIVLERTKDMNQDIDNGGKREINVEIKKK